MKWQGRLPNGKITTNENEYVSAWRKTAAPLEKLMGWKLHTFDPGISFVVNKTGYVERIPVDLAIAIGKLSK